jgi:hypothetical protein
MAANGGGADCIVQLGILILTAYTGCLRAASWTGTTLWTAPRALDRAPPRWTANRHWAAS